MKKRFSAIAAIMLVISMVLSSCGGGSTGGASPSPEVSAETESESPEAETSESPEQAPESAGPVAANDIESSKDTLILRLQSDPGTVDIALGSITEAIQTMSLIGNSLLVTKQDENGAWSTIPDDKYSLATGYEFDEDYLGMTWFIREGVLCHDGTPFTAEDVAFSIQRYSTNATYFFIDFENIEVIDELTLHVPFVEPNATVVSRIGAMLMCSKDAVEAAPDDPLTFSKNFMGTGPWRITDWVDGDSIRLEAFEDYFAGAPKIKNIIIRFIGDASVAMMEMETGGVDLIDVPSWSSVQSVMNGDYEGQIKYTSAVDRYLLNLGFNSTPDSPFSDVKVRQAVAYALDREAIAYGAFEGIGETVGTIFSVTFDNMQDYSSEWPYERDIEKAKALLAEAGYENGFDATIINYGDQNDVLANQMIKNQLAEIGINLSIESYDTATWISIMTEQTEGWDMWLRLWGGSGSFANFIWQTIPQITQVSPETDPAFAELFDLGMEAIRELDDVKRAEIEKEIQDRYLQEWMYTYPIIQKIQYVLYADNLQAVERHGYYWFMLDSYFE